MLIFCRNYARFIMNRILGLKYKKIYNELLLWKEKNMRIPLIVIGARQVGKTYLIDEFCK